MIYLCFIQKGEGVESIHNLIRKGSIYPVMTPFQKENDSVYKCQNVAQAVFIELMIRTSIVLNLLMHWSEKLNENITYRLERFSLDTMTSISYSIRISIVSLDFKLKLLHTETEVWISYEFLKCVVQSDVFQPSEAARLEPFVNDFEFHGTWKELEWILADPLDIHLCGSEQVYGRARIPLNQLHQNVSEDGESTFQFLDKENQSIGVLVIYLKLNSSSIHVDQPYIQYADESHTSLAREKELLEREKRLVLAEADFERKMKDALSHRSRTEAAFREHLRKKEETVKLVLENQMKKNNEEQTMILGKFRDEYKKLESRLKVALTEIEAKERDMNRQLTDMKVKLSVFKEESQHAVDCEISKAKILEQKVDEEKNRGNRLEAELSDLRASYNSSGQAKAENEVRILQHKIQELELKLSKSSHELQGMSSEKEHYRLAAHRLAKIVRQERMQSQKETKYNCHFQNQELVDEIRLTESCIIPPKSRKHSEKLINLKAELTKLSTSIEK